MSYKIYHNPRCSKSRQTLSLLTDNGINPQIIEYLKTVPSKMELQEILKLLKIDAIDLIRKGENIYKESYKGKKLSDKEWIDAMIENPKLIERPIVIKNKMAIIGRPPEKVLELLLEN